MGKVAALLAQLRRLSDVCSGQDFSKRAVIVSVALIEAQPPSLAFLSTLFDACCDSLRPLAACASQVTFTGLRGAW